MFIVRIIVNALIMAVEVAAIVGVAYLGFAYPLVFASVTAALALALGLGLEYARLKNELPFYFDRPMPKTSMLLSVVAFGEAASKALLAGVVAVLTVSGTDRTRLLYEAIVFAVTLYVAVNMLRWLAHGVGARPARWGYFRIAPPLGLVFSLGLTALVVLGLMSSPSLLDIGKKAILETAPRPTLAQASELLFLFKQWFDGTIVAVLSGLVGPTTAKILGIFLSVNVLSGFVIAVYAVVITEVALALEDRLLPG
jgi:hypothetical protein